MEKYLAQGLGAIGKRSKKSWLPTRPGQRMRYRGADPLMLEVQEDRGCRYGGPSCLACLLPRCWYDLSAGDRNKMLAERKRAASTTT